MAHVIGHLELEELQRRYRSSGDGVLSRHYQVIWHLAQGRTCAEVAALTGFVRRWVEELLARYNAFGPDSLGDRRRGNGAAARVLTPAVLDALRDRLQAPPDAGGLWTARKVAAVMAAELGLTHVAMQRGWEALRALGWTIQMPRPRHARAASPEAQADFKKNLQRRWRKSRTATPEPSSKPLPPMSTASARKPILRRVWSPRAARPIATVHHRFEWLYVTAFVSPATGESHWYIADGIDN